MNFRILEYLYWKCPYQESYYFQRITENCSYQNPLIKTITLMIRTKSRYLFVVYDWLREASYPSLNLQKDPQEESDHVENASVFDGNSLQQIFSVVVSFLLIPWRILMMLDLKSIQTKYINYMNDETFNDEMLLSSSSSLKLDFHY